MVGRLNPAAISIARHGTKNLLCKVQKHQLLHQRAPHFQKSMSILSLWKLQYYKDTNITNLPPAHLVGSHVLMPWLPTRQLLLLRLGWTTWSPHGLKQRVFSHRFAAIQQFLGVLGSDFLPNTYKARTSLGESGWERFRRFRWRQPIRSMKNSIHFHFSISLPTKVSHYSMVKKFMDHMLYHVKTAHFLFLAMIGKDDPQSI